VSESVVVPGQDVDFKSVLLQAKAKKSGHAAYFSLLQ